MVNRNLSQIPIASEAGDYDWLLGATNDSPNVFQRFPVAVIRSPSAPLQKGNNIESLSSTKQLEIGDAYFQFLTPTVASVIVKLPVMTDENGVDLGFYFEGELYNDSNGTNEIVLQESDGTAIVTLSSTTSLKGIFYYWDGSIWRVREVSYYG